MKYLDLCKAMQDRTVVTVRGVTGTINSIAAEDGSGGCWNVHMCCRNNVYRTVFVRCN